MTNPALDPNARQANTLQPTRALIVQEMTQVGGKQVNCPRGAFPGHNFMTNYTIGYYQVGAYIVELSEGDFMGDKVIGVTVVKAAAPHVSEYDLSGACFSLEEMKAKLEGLKA